MMMWNSRLGQSTGGSAAGLGGHNGLKSIRDALGTPDFHRLRIGVGRPERGSVHSWVLGRFHPGEKAALPVILRAAGEGLLAAIGAGFHHSTERLGEAVEWESGDRTEDMV